MVDFRQAQIDKQMKLWEKSREKVPEESAIPFVTISREYGCGGYEIATKLAELLSAEMPWTAYDRHLLEKLMADMGLNRTLVETLTGAARNALTNVIQTSFSSFPPQVAVYRKLAETIRMLALNGHAVIVGRAGSRITKDMKGGYHVRLVASLDWRIERVAEKSKKSRGEARTMIVDNEKNRETFIREFVKFDITDPHNYHLVINNTHHDTEQVARIILQGMKSQGLLPA